MAAVCAGCATAYEREAALALPGALAWSRAKESGKPIVTPPKLRKARCDFIEEEGSEFDCRYEEQAGSGAWVKASTFIAPDGDHWVDIGSASTADEILTEKRRP